MSRKEEGDLGCQISSLIPHYLLVGERESSGHVLEPVLEESDELEGSKKGVELVLANVVEL